MAQSIRGLLRTAAALALLYALAVAVGFALFLMAFRIGILAGIGILFYRGLVVIAGAFGLLLAGLVAVLARSRWSALGPRDAFAAAALSLAVNLAFLIVVPVTVDRSISIFVLGEMAAQPDRTFTAEQMSALFARVYVGDMRQIDRRLREQAISGNVEPVDGGYRISAHGRLVIDTAKIVAALFDSHAGLAAPSDARQAASNPPRIER